MADTDSSSLQSLHAPANPPPYLSGLNPGQRAAVEALDGPLLVLAGAGTGKTRVLTTRIAHILWTRRAFPSQILAVTFTNKAAREMQERVGGLIGGAVEGMPWLGTFHSIGAKILRRHAELAGLQPDFTILDTDDQIRLLKQLLSAANIDDKRWPARSFAAMIDRWKNQGLTPGNVPESAAFGFADGKGRELYAAYQARLKVLNAADFGDLLLECLNLFQRNPEVLAQYHDRFRYILVDEYQDTNVAQYLWLRLLAQGRRNLCCVGDDDQSIYGWRGAEIGNILRFEKDFPGARIVRLEQNYRSTPNILAAASGMIAANEGRLGKTLWTEYPEPGEKILITGVWDGEEEARRVAEQAAQLQRQRHRLADMAILVRASRQTLAFEECFLREGIPYRVIGGPRFYERMEIRDAIAYLRVIAQPNDDLAFERIVNKPKRGIGEAALQRLHQTARAQNIPLTRALRLLLETDELPGRARTPLRALEEDFSRWRTLLAMQNHAQLAQTVLDESGYTAMLKADRSADAPGRLENLKELVTAMEAFENLGGFLEHVALVMENQQSSSDDRINIMTLHSAKGLEFRTVFLPGWEDGLFPSQRSMDESGAAGLEEERRLAYVGITRARERAFISFAANRRMYNLWQPAMPSRFISELPPANVSMDTDQGVYGGLQENHSPFADSYESPGWRRMQARRQGGRVIDVPSYRVQETPKARHDFVKGARVFHDRFGYGRVKDFDGDKLEIDFEKAGCKKIIRTFVQPA
ncbi:MAG TPA: ATP-dependent DNA helicase [Alphaproteobacteria bacterium]|jgi:DNA helicase II / ATP-dependent DNA helicase PcrA|nr:ATP-dependent DNA helicase [Alphaproteobacteria bacterium]